MPQSRLFRQALVAPETPITTPTPTPTPTELSFPKFLDEALSKGSIKGKTLNELSKPEINALSREYATYGSIRGERAFNTPVYEIELKYKKEFLDFCECKIKELNRD